MVDSGGVWRPHPISERVDFFPSPIPSFLPHSKRCFNPIPFICGVGGGGSGCPFPPCVLSFPSRKDGRTVVSNELATVHFTPTVKICGRKKKTREGGAWEE